MIQISDGRQIGNGGTMEMRKNLSDYLSVLDRRKWLILWFFVVVVGVVAAYCFIADPVYRSTALLMIDKKPSPMNPLGEEESRSPQASESYYNTQINLLNHNTLIMSVIDELGLKKYYAAQLEENQESASAAHAGINPPEAQLSDEIFKIYTDSLEIEPVRDSNLVYVSFSGSDPEMVARIVNTHSQKAIESAVALHREHAETALRWLKAQLEKQKSEVEENQRRIYDFKKKHNILSVANTEDISGQELTELSTALTRARSERIAKQSAYLSASQVSSDQMDIFLSPELSENSVITTLRNQMVNLKSLEIEMGTQYGAKHPKMQQIKFRIAETKADLDREIGRLKSTYKREADKAAQVESAIEKMFDERKQSLMALGEKSIEYDVLRQQAESSKEIFDFLLKQAEEINLSSVMSSSSLRVIDRAEVPVEAIWPKKKLSVLLAAMLSLTLGIGLVLFIDYMDNTIKTPSDVYHLLNIPVLGTVPYNKELKNIDKKLLTQSHSKRLEHKERLDTPLSGISSRLPAELLSMGDGTQGRVIAVESVTEGEGKTMTTSKIAASLSEAGLRVLLIDCDFQRSTFSHFLSDKNGGGLENIMMRIGSHQLRNGALKDYSMDDIFFLVGLHKLSGRLMVKNNDQILQAFFQNGKLLHIQRDDNNSANRIGTMLIQNKSINNDQLNDALERHHRTGQSLGYILVNSGYISIDQLKGPLRLQMEEHIQRLFGLKTGQFQFKPEMIRVYDSEKIYFTDSYATMINELGRMSGSKLIEKEVLANISSGLNNNLYYLPANSKTKKPVGRFNRALLKKVIDVTKERFDVVLIDTPPLDAATGIESIFPLVDGVILVIAAGNLSYRVIGSAVNAIPQDKIIGAVLNKVEASGNRYNYYM
jgi:uncharacterized protein involved in exopolysaccharide biosynthesis/cellulose biosynthesis protein BcsQ